MQRTMRVLQVPAELIERAEREDRLPPGAGLVIAFGLSFIFYATVIALVA